MLRSNGYAITSVTFVKPIVIAVGYVGAIVTPKLILVRGFSLGTIVLIIESKSH